DTSLEVDAFSGHAPYKAPSRHIAKKHTPAPQPLSHEGRGAPKLSQSNIRRAFVSLSPLWERAGVRGALKAACNSMHFLGARQTKHKRDHNTSQKSTRPSPTSGEGHQS